MKTLHYYCSGRSSLCVETPIEDELKHITSLLTRGTISRLVSQMADGEGPFLLRVPREAMLNAHEWDLPKTLIRILPVESRKDAYPVDTADLVFESVVVVIHALRLDQPAFLCPPND